jgi:Holliday junction DNA helicase RuvB
MLTAPMRSRFGIPNRLDYYTVEEIQHILMRSARLMAVPMEDGGAREIAQRSRGTPRIANHLLRWVRDFAQVKAQSVVTQAVASQALTMRDIDETGLDEMDKRFLEALIHKFDGGPVGMSSLGVAIGEDASTLEDVHEPYLVMQGFVKRTPRGRVAMPAAYRKLGLVPPLSGQNELF